jgi:hypothetical protein
VGARNADTALELTFPTGTEIAPGDTLIIEGKLHDRSWNLTFDEHDDWSWYARSDSLAENIVVQNKATKAIVFGSSPETATSGAYAMAISPNPVNSKLTATFRIDDPNMSGRWLGLTLYSGDKSQGSWFHRVVATGPQTHELDLSECGSLSPGDYTLALEFGLDVMDHVEFQKLEE